MLVQCLLALRTCKRGCRPWHELLAYETTKRVVIKDPAIGVLRLLGIIVVTVYLCMYRIYQNQAYFMLENVAATVQTSLKGPDSLPRTSQLEYCELDSGDPPPKAALTNLQCTTGPDAWVAAPSFGGSELFVATRLKDIMADGSTVRSFVIKPEDYTVGITFTVQALSFYHATKDPMYAKTNQELETRLVGNDGLYYTDGVTKNGRWDIIPVWRLLHAAGIDTLETPHEQQPTVTLRYTGLVLLLSIDCPMERSGSVIRCDYKVRHMAGSAAEAFVVSSAAKSQPTEVQERRGVKVIFDAAGSMGRFDLSTLMLAWVASLALVEIITIVINWMLNYVLPYKDVYRMLMYDESPNFHELRSGSKSAKAAVERLKKTRAMAAGEGEGFASQPDSPMTGNDASTTGSSGVAKPPTEQAASHSTPPSMVPAGMRPHVGGSMTPPLGMQPQMMPQQMMPQQMMPQAGGMRPGGVGPGGVGLAPPPYQQDRSRSVSPQSQTMTAMAPSPNMPPQDRSRSVSPQSQTFARTPSPGTPQQGWRPPVASPAGSGTMPQAYASPPPTQGSSYRQRAPGAITVDVDAF